MQILLAHRRAIACLKAMAVWLFVFVLAMDLATSPFHHHVHDAGEALSAMQDAGGFDANTVHVEADEHTGGGHAMALLLPRVPEAERSAFQAELAQAGPYTLARQFEARAHEKPLGAPEPVPVASDRHRRPSSRAPPFLHA